MESLANKITSYVMNNGIIEQEDYAIYQYGFQTGLESVICLVFSIVIAYMLNVFIEFLIVACILLPLRAYLCGIHMKKFSACFVCSVVLVTYGPVLAKHIFFSKYEILIIAVGIMYFIHKLAFVTTKHHCDSQEVFFFAKQRMKILIGTLVLLIIFFLFDTLGFMHQVLYSLIVALFSVLLEILSIKNKET